MTQPTKPRNVFIIGAQCTGKTTLVKAVCEYIERDDTRAGGSGRILAPAVVSEVARKVLTRYEFTRDDITTSVDRCLQLQEHIIKAQLEAENTKIKEHPNSWYISDRSGIDPIVYAHLYAGQKEAEHLLDSPEWATLQDRMKNGLVILCEAGTSWLIDDGTRLMPTNLEDWMRVDSTFRKLLGLLGIGYVTVSKDILEISERVAVVINAM